MLLKITTLFTQYLVLLLLQVLLLVVLVLLLFSESEKKNARHVIFRAQKYRLRRLLG